ncbi:hypothetical protein BRE01_27980 [Brevibacillus reuszeri]|uniref:DUF3892 domain-containing protein n=1 Tax=Brevibacillus reuszeri TaxID=54915 RepID=A0A0K9YIS8_9BACL|nr:DUF3892 domain-containing protein [Brevibacillus reuszeri]KNB68598.1 hypothetical protein ADS79_31995 [Brevibacillus reuszeri]MED1858882.1 DUF3892 domain-containing protein [Brevibacillus reuszeri]GED69096.1 hypothetical protein BRE01_27980 [Brevibacillus reuszeri]
MKEQSFEEIYAAYKNAGEEQAIEDNDGSTTLPDASGKEQIVAVRKNDDGDLIAFKTSAGRELDYVTALQDAKAGKLAHVDVFHKYGRDILRSEPDGIKENNLDNLPTF